MAAFRRRLERLAKQMGADEGARRAAERQHQFLIQTIARNQIALLRQAGREREATAEDLAQTAGDWAAAAQFAAEREAREPKPPPEIQADSLKHVPWIAGTARLP